MAFWLPLLKALGTAGKAAGTVGKAAGTVGKAAGSVGKAVGGFAKGAAGVLPKAGKAGSGMATKGGAKLIKGAKTTVTKTGKAAQTSRAWRAGAKTGKLVTGAAKIGLATGGGGSGAVGGAQSSEEAAPASQGQTQFTSRSIHSSGNSGEEQRLQRRKIGGNPLHSKTHKKIKIDKPVDPNAKAPNPGVIFEESKKKMSSKKKVGGNPVKKGTHKVPSSSPKVGSEKRRTEKIKKFSTQTRKKAQQRKASLKAPSQTRRQGPVNKRTRSGPVIPKNQLREPNRNINMPTEDSTTKLFKSLGTKGKQAMIDQGFAPPVEGAPTSAGNLREGLEGIPPPASRETNQPWYSKAADIVGGIATAGAPGGVRQVMKEHILPGEKWKKKQADVEDDRDLYWRIADNKVKNKDVAGLKKLIKQPEFTEAFVQRIPGVNDADDVAEFLQTGMQENITPSEFFKNQRYSPVRFPDSIPVMYRGIKVWMAPENVVMGKDQRMTTPEGEVLTPSEEQGNRFDFLKTHIAAQQEDASPTQAELPPDIAAPEAGLGLQDPRWQEAQADKDAHDEMYFGSTGQAGKKITAKMRLKAHLDYAATQKDRYTNELVGDALVRQDNFTGERISMNPKQMEEADIRIEMFDDGFEDIGYIIYDSKNIDEKGEPRAYDQVLFSELFGDRLGGAEGGGPMTLTPEMLRQLPENVQDAWEKKWGQKIPGRIKGKKKRNPTTDAVRGYVESSTRDDI